MVRRGLSPLCTKISTKKVLTNTIQSVILTLSKNERKVKKMVQVKFKDLDGLEYGGIQLDDGDVICGCCGGLFTADEIGPLEDGNEIEILKTYNEWVPFSNEIID